MLVAFECACIGAFADGARPLSNDDNVESAAGEGGGCGSLAPWGTRTVAAPINLIAVGSETAIAIVVVVVVISRVFHCLCHHCVAIVTSIAIAVAPSIATVAIAVTAAPSIAIAPSIATVPSTLPLCCPLLLLLRLPMALLSLHCCCTFHHHCCCALHCPPTAFHRCLHPPAAFRHRLPPL